MSWMTLLNVARAVPTEYGAFGPSTPDLTYLYAHPVRNTQQPHSRNARGLGSASAASPWAWAEPGVAPARRDTVTRAAEHHVRVEHEVLRAVAATAQFSGRSEDDIWNEAASEWLSRHGWDDEPPPTTPSAAPRPRPARAWSGIDTILADLRQPAIASLASLASHNESAA